MIPLPDIAGSNSAVPLSQSASPAGAALKASWIVVIVTGSGTVRFGGNGPNAPTATLGLPIPAGGSFTYMQRKPPENAPYDLSLEQAYIPVGATISVGFWPT